MLKPTGYIFYRAGSNLYFLLVKLISPFNKRARKLTLGQNGLLGHIIENEKLNHSKNIWFHVSSLGEFEQGRPVIEGLKKLKPDHRVVVTFFSPSGYEQRKSDSLCDAVYYLPFESDKNAHALLNAINPVMAFWVKYDFWYCYLKELHQRKIPVFLLAAQFRQNQVFFKPFATFHRGILDLFTYIFCQNQVSQNLLNEVGIHHHILTGDNRYDRVFQHTLNQDEVPFIADFHQNSFLLIGGSTYEIEEDLIEKFLDQTDKTMRVIIAPHFVNKERIQSIESRFAGNCIKYSSIKNPSDISNQQVLIMDSIGQLSRLYRYGDAAIIGGGFWENGLHNSLEAAAYGMPICFGPKINRFPEAMELVQEEIAYMVSSKSEFGNWLSEMKKDTHKRQNIKEKSKAFVTKNQGATQLVLNKVMELTPQ